MEAPNKSVWDIYIDFMKIIFGVDFPPAVSAFILILFVFAIFCCLIKIFKLIFGGWF